MTHFTSPLRALTGAVLLAASAVGSSQAATLDFLFTDHGSVSAGVPTPVSVSLVGAADDWAGAASPIPGTWVDTTVIQLGGAAFTGTFNFTDTSAAGNSFSGTVSGTLASLNPSGTLLKAELTYAVTSGSGVFAGATGSGLATAYIDGAKSNYVSSGGFIVNAVPEPESWALMGAGLLTFGVLHRKRSLGRS